MRAAMFFLIAGVVIPTAGIRADDAPTGWEFTGKVEADATATLQSRVTGFLTQLAVKEGALVAKGDLLIEIDSRPYQLALDAAVARLQFAEAKLQAAKILSADTQTMLEKKMVSSQELALKKAAESEAEAALRLSKVEVEQAQLTLSWTRVTAPLSGRVSRIQVAEGELITANQTSILTIVSTDALHIAFSVPESILLHLRRDGLADPDKLRVVAGYPDEKELSHRAQLQLVDPEVDSKTACARFRASVPNPDGLLSPGMSARVRLTPAPK